MLSMRRQLFARSCRFYSPAVRSVTFQSCIYRCRRGESATSTERPCSARLAMSATALRAPNLRLGVWSAGGNDPTVMNVLPGSAELRTLIIYVAVIAAIAREVVSFTRRRMRTTPICFWMRDLKFSIPGSRNCRLCVRII